MSPSKSTNNEVNLRTFRYSADHTKPTEIYDVDNFIQGEFRPSASKDWIDVHDPAVNEVVTRVPQSTRDELEAAVASARNAFPLWRDTSIMKRQQIMFRLTQLIRDHMDIIAISITKEQGKTLADARGDVLRGLQVCETACGITTQLTGEVLEVAKDMETRSYREPLGIVTAICPFNFPAMIPLWSLPIAIVTGNVIIIKPSERDPGAAMIIAELCHQAGVPPGVVNMVHGTHTTVNFLIDHPEIRAISFVGSNKAGQYIYERGSANGKRVQPDSNKDHALGAIAGAAFGAAGQRCMALSAMITVGSTRTWIADLVKLAEDFRMGPGFDGSSSLGPMISPTAQQRCVEIIESAEREGARIILDGRGQYPKGYPNGNWVSNKLLRIVTCRPLTLIPIIGWTYNHYWGKNSHALLQGRDLRTRFGLS
jgi:malonate-semialdehyde dehydrogenase (acetylating)/methylmalonate-semialdehyde dehydrogenase